MNGVKLTDEQMKELLDNIMRSVDSAIKLTFLKFHMQEVREKLESDC